MSVEAVRQALPYLIPKINRAVVQTVELADTLYSMHSKGQAKEINSLGARVTFKTQVGTNYGNPSSGGYFREPGHHTSKQATIGFARDAIAHGVDGDYFDNVEGTDAIGGKLKELMKDNVLYIKKQRDIDFCHGNGQGVRGTVSSTTPSTTSVVVFTSEEGTRFLDEGETYFFHDPTDGTAHGATAGHTVNSIDSTTQATFSGNTDDNTNVTAGDVAVHKASADGESSFNRALYGYEHFFLDTGAYFGLDKDADAKIRGLRVNANSSLVSLSLLEKGITKWMYRWNSGEPQGLVDCTSPAQYAAYKLLGYTMRRLTENTRSFDGAFTKVSDGEREIYIDANIRPTNWFRYDKNIIERYEFKPTGIWRMDDLTMRAPQASGSIQDSVFWIINGKEQMFCNNPARGIWYYSLSTTGLETGI